jgi:hypothetical protein
MLDPHEQKIAQLERQVRQLMEMCSKLIQRTEFLERENSRRRNDIVKIATHNKG